MRIKRVPVPVDTLNFIGSQNAASQEQQFVPPSQALVHYSGSLNPLYSQSTQMTSTPHAHANHNRSRLNFGVSPIERVNGIRNPFFEDDSVSTISRVSGGIPRALNHTANTTFDASRTLHGVKGGRVQKIYKPPIKRKPGFKALQEIRAQQKSTEMLFKVAPFARVVKEILQKVAPGVGYRIQSNAMHALMEAAQEYLVTIYESSNLLAQHAKRVTLMPKDMQLLRRILSIWGME